MFVGQLLTTMTKQQKVGLQGEDLAARYLLDKGYRIIERNWRFSRAEIDIIAFHGDLLVFVEVKTRSYDYYGPPEAFVDEKKEALMADAAYRFIDHIDHQGEVRFDIVSILLNDSARPVIEHFVDAFFPGLESD